MSETVIEHVQREHPEWAEFLLEWVPEQLQDTFLELSNPHYIERKTEELVEDLEELFDDIPVELYRGFVEEVGAETDLLLFHLIREIIAFSLDSIYEIPPFALKSCETAPPPPPQDTTKINTLLSLSNNNQRTDEWFQQRQNLISASNCWMIFGTDAQQRRIIQEKCVPPPTYNSSGFGQGSLSWGIKYEPLSTLLYEKYNACKIGQLGCIVHPTVGCLGASPDGIVITESSPKYGFLIEIKNIVNREITGLPSMPYWIQTQIQMECCNIDFCDFVETRFKEIAQSEFSVEDSRECGVCISMKHNQTQACHFEYVLAEKGVDTDEGFTERFRRLIENQPSCTAFDISYWVLDEYSCVLIPRNRAWFRQALPLIQETWDRVEERRSTEGCVKTHTPLCVIKLDWGATTTTTPETTNSAENEIND